MISGIHTVSGNVLAMTNFVVGTGIFDGLPCICKPKDNIAMTFHLYMHFISTWRLGYQCVFKPENSRYFQLVGVTILYTIQYN